MLLYHFLFVNILLMFFFVFVVQFNDNVLLQYLSQYLLASLKVAMTQDLLRLSMFQ